MKTLILIIILGLGAAIAAPFSNYPASVANPQVLYLDNIGIDIPALRETLDSGKGNPYSIVLDTLETDTGYVEFNLLRKPIFTHTDTLGTLSFTCKDSTGTDTLAIIGKWMGNPRCDGKGKWDNVDSTELKDLGASGNAAQGVYTTKRAYVVNTGGFCLYRFFLRNKLNANANRKSTCKDVIFSSRPRAGFRP